MLLIWLFLKLAALKATFYSENNVILEQKIEDLCENLDRKTLVL